ncbi:hypothetical protein COCSADRAFT_24257 [Bipolaris sorokiniana ND90Pr]|uniref:Uncharacterized protein n=1 Tax=Cochliobolus sativus (strain ND90Pr / ATCC 201652) TaxID=665912 RepID=M2TAA7_COCSN|nr:uncharacterized protein COCSADRAFT_24257 [Bipolaris sorokiniana ND90Pr]EMD66121.1 hypothetical protein COCSADRAFT_24257 [Bipolaris sorokiniana ND90Pr]
MARRWFTEFMNNVYPDTDTEATYFTPGVDPPRIAILKDYALYLVRSRVGRISDKLSVNFVQPYMGMIVFIMQRCCNHLPTDITTIRAEIRNFFRTDLVENKGVNTKLHPKTVAHTEDGTRILSSLYNPQCLITFTNMQTVLKFV